jgi:hypothetical protein
MDLYISSLLLGAIGLAAMALSGLGHHGHEGSHGMGANGAAHHLGHAHVHTGRHAPGARSGTTPASSTISKTLLQFTSPRFVFSLLLGFGAAGTIVRPVAGGVVQAAIAVLGAVVLERFLVSPLWNFAMRFASEPATTLESAIMDEATAVTSFDANGQGIVSIEVDGQIVQILATLRSDDRALGGSRIRAGQRVRIEDVDALKNCCTVSLI